MTPYVREYQEGDAEVLAPILRQADLQELQASSPLPPYAVLRQSAEESLPACTVIGASGRVAALFGAVPSLAPSGIIWLLGSDELTKGATRREFLRQCPTYLHVLHEQYPLLYNYIDERNTVHIRWLKWMGFTFIQRHSQHGHEQRPFLEFVRLK